MQIKKVQVMIAFMFGLLALVISFIRQIANWITIDLIDATLTDPLQQFPYD